MNSPARKKQHPPLFRAVRKGRRYEEVAGQIQRLVSEGMLKPGDRLPAERELAAQFGVGRSSLRDAIRTLEVMGVVESRHGAGTVIRDLDIDALVVPIASALLRKREMVSELLEVRMMIEPAVAARAAKNATREEIARMEEILGRQREKVRRGEPTVEEDAQFHAALVHAARNSVVLRVVDVLMDLLRESRAKTLQTPGRLEKSYAGHVRILRAVKERDGVGAERAVRRHLKEVQAIVLSQL
jgi:GntR family transcriptional repressor for pyruvate dehydrogenase complex